MTITEIIIYPIKSLSGISVRRAVVERRGLQHDRRWMLVDTDGNLLTQREFPQLAALSVKIMSDGLSVSNGRFGEVIVPEVSSKAEKVRVRVWKSFCQAVVSEPSINRWFSGVLGNDCRLVFMPPETERAINPKFNTGGEVVSFADGYPVLVIGESSLADLNRRLENEITMDRFRPNIVVSGSEPYAEDQWKKIRIGNVRFRSAKPCARCVVTTIDQQSGISTGNEPLRTLATFRQAHNVFPDSFRELELQENSVLFGQNLIPESFGTPIGIGDQVIEL